MPLDEGAYSRKMEEALQAVRAILGRAKNVDLASDVSHQYDDKYAIVEFLSCSALSSILDTLLAMGMQKTTLVDFVKQSKQRCVTLRFSVSESCEYGGVKQTDVVCGYGIDHRNGIISRRQSSAIIHRVTRHLWKFQSHCELSIFAGNTPDNKVCISSWLEKADHYTDSDAHPKPEVCCPSPSDLQLTHLFDLLDDTLCPQFYIDRSSLSCRTPRRNTEVDSLLGFFHEWAAWCSAVVHHFTTDFPPLQYVKSSNLDALDPQKVFVPVLPVFSLPSGTGTDDEQNENTCASLVLDANDQELLLTEHRESLNEKLQGLSSLFPDEPKAEGGITSKTARLLMICAHLQQIFQLYNDAAHWVEDMLRQQLVAAVGRTLGPEDFAAYMDFHFGKYFRPEYRIRPLSYFVRRAEQAPYGAISIETTWKKGDMLQPIRAMSHQRQVDGQSVHFPLDAATTVHCHGEQYVHALLVQRFPDQALPTLQLIARVQHFNSFVLLVGRMQEKGGFKPMAACVMQNGEELRIPLHLEPLPTAKEFQDAVYSLSPAQRDFANALRTMQLEGTLFGVLVVQTTPALEALLGLSPGALTKEVQLAHDIMELFIEYQIPSDLLSCTGPENPASPAIAPVEVVRRHVKQMQSMVNKARKAKEMLTPSLPQVVEVPQPKPPVIRQQVEPPTASQEAGNPIIYAAIARNSDIFADHPPNQRSAFSQICTRLVRLSAAETNSRATHFFGEGGYRFTRFVAGNLIYVCVSNIDTPLTYCINFLRSLQSAHSQRCGEEAELIREQMGRRHDSKIRIMQQEIDDVKVVMMDNIERLLRRGEMLDSLNERAADLAMVSNTFYCSKQSKSSFFSKVQTAVSTKLPSSSSSSTARIQSKVPPPQPTAPPVAPVGHSPDLITAPSKTADSGSSGHPNVGANSTPAETSTPAIDAATPSPTPNQVSSGPLEVVVDDHCADLTQLPAELDRRFGMLDRDSVVRPTTINPGPSWQRVTRQWTNRTPQSHTVDSSDQAQAKAKAMDLLDALTRSGALSLQHSQLHVILAFTHCFDKTLMETVVQDNVNPIDLVERSALIIGSTIHGQPPAALVTSGSLPRIAGHSPFLCS